MKFFISDRVTENEKIDFELTNSYLEVEIPFENDSSIFLYIIPRTDHSAFVLACLDNGLDNLLDDIDESTYKMIYKTWPTLAELIYNGIKDIYSNGALIKLEDFDNGESKWFVASVAGNLNFDNVDELFTPHMFDTMKGVHRKTLDMLVELRENKPSYFRSFFSGFFNGIKNSINTLFGVDTDDLFK